ncbi:hypothetical protein, partial [Xanthomonas nasturtii]
GRTACTHGRKLPETSAYSNENWQFQQAENAGDALQWMWFGGFSGATNEKSRRSQSSAQHDQASSDDEGLEMQMSRAARFNTEEALYEERKAKGQ